ncbi:MAG: endolytic transglycosylase MltG [Crocinitomicaceae bacterium]
MKKFILLGVVGVLVVGGFFAYPYISLYLASSKSALTVEEGSTKDIFIKTGADLEWVVNYLDGLGILEDKAKFQEFAEKKSYKGKNIVPGKYVLKGGMNYNDLINHLRAGNGRVEVQVTFNGCRTIEDMAGKVSKNIEADSAALVNYILSDSVMSKYGFDEKTIRALFIPNTYQMLWDTDEKEFVQRMAKEWKNYWNAGRTAKAKKLNLTQSQVATLASIVREEQSLHEDEWPTIAGVYINRLNRGMLLQADPTVKYCLGDFSIKRIYLKDLEVDCEYNTYKNPGLPPGPLNIPSPKGMDAVLDFKQTDYIYFCAKADDSGRHAFAVTLAQHNQNAAKYHAYINKIGVR